MYKELANSITSKFIKSGIIDEEQQDIYAYGFEVLISSTMYFLILFLVSVVFKCVFSSLVYLLGLILIRKICGGHHANHYSSCQLLFEANHLAFVALYHLVDIRWYRLVTVSVFTFAIISIFVAAPVDHKKKPFIKNEYKRYRYLSLFYCVILLILLVLTITQVLKPGELLFSFSIGTLSAIISLLCGKISRMKERSSP